MTAAILSTFTTPAGATIRGVEIDGNPWFVAADFCRALDLAVGPDGSFRQHSRKLAADERLVRPWGAIQTRTPDQTRTSDEGMREMRV
jgi:prophage antirepressor-like protein